MDQPRIIAATSILELLSEKIVGQPAISGIISTVNMYQAGLSPAGRPAGIFLLLGPTGTGKTRTVEALAEILHSDAKKVIKIDCGEFQSDHEIAKLIGAPPGYLGHRETRPALTQERLEEAKTEFCDLSVVLFDEIEKAAPAVTKLLLGVLDKATLRLGDNSEVNFEKSLIFLTSNVGAREMMKELQPELGFRNAAKVDAADARKKLEAIGLNAMRRMYSPEFVNRLDAVITYRPLDSEALRLILEHEIADLQKHVNSRLNGKCFNIEVAEDSRGFLLERGTSPEYGARELKRSIHQFLTQPLATLLIRGQIAPGSTVTVALDATKEGLHFSISAGRDLVLPSIPTILVVDDNRDFLHLLSLELTSSTGWRIVTAQSCAEADAAWSGQRIDFALLDLILPDGNGLDMAKLMKEKNPALQAAIMTGGELTPDEDHDCQQYRFASINKPFLPQHLIDLMKLMIAQASTAVA